MNNKKQKELQELLKNYIEFKNFYDDLQNITSFEITTYRNDKVEGNHKRVLKQFENGIFLNNDYFFLDKIKKEYLKEIIEMEERLGIENKEKEALTKLKEQTNLDLELDRITKKYKECKEHDSYDWRLFEMGKIIADMLIFIELLKIEFKISTRTIDNILEEKLQSIKREFYIENNK